MSYFIAFGAVVASYAVGVSLVKKDCNAKCQNKIARETKQLRLENQELIKRINDLEGKARRMPVQSKITFQLFSPQLNNHLKITFL